MEKITSFDSERINCPNLHSNFDSLSWVTSSDCSAHFNIHVHSARFSHSSQTPEEYCWDYRRDERHILPHSLWSCSFIPLRNFWLEEPSSTFALQSSPSRGTATLSCCGEFDKWRTQNRATLDFRRKSNFSFLAMCNSDNFSWLGFYLRIALCSL